MGNTRNILEPLKDDKLVFRCHKNLSCFTECCRDLNLVLTPYDIIRLKKRLKLDSDSFLKEYTHSEINEESGLPMVFLSMNEDARRTCRFVTPNGCTVYEDRPGACRIYPLGRAATKQSGQPRSSEKYFVVREPHCKGFEENKSWALSEWLNHEGLHEYNRNNDSWTEIVTNAYPIFKKGLDQKKLGMFFMASYNLDMFRRFLYTTSFMERFDISDEEQERITREDMALSNFAFRWIRFFLLGEPVLRLRGIA